jgi:diguanylate cyclase
MNPAVKHTPGSGRRFVERLYRLRIVGLALGFLCIASVFIEEGRSLIFWALLVFHCILWPHIARRAAYNWRVPLLGEYANLIIDSAFVGFWIVAMRFNAFPSILIVVMLNMNNMAVGGLRLFFGGAASQIMGLLVGLLSIGFAFAPASPTPTILACLPFLVIYPLSVGWSAFRISRKLAEKTRELELLSRTDGLTGLLNRHTWEGLLADEFERCRMERSAASLLLIDIDHFKRINDTHGHPAGDAVLRIVATLLRDHFRGNDIIGRYGGEEFGVVLRGAPLEMAKTAAARFVVTVRERTSGADHAFPCTISIGVAQCNASMPNYLSWLQNADVSLYAAKRAGRNRVGA